MAFSLIECSNALLESQQRFADFCSIYFSLFALLVTVSSSFVSCQINKGYFAENALLFFDCNLQNSMRAGRFTVGVILRGDSKYAAFLNKVKKLFSTVDLLLFEADNIDVAFVVLTNLENLSVVEQIVKLATVYFKESDMDLLGLMLWLNYTSNTCSKNRKISLAPR